MNKETLTGQCLCGQITINVEPQSAAGIVKCYCRDCQQHLGNFAPWVVCDVNKTIIDGPVGKYSSSDVANRLFCTHCGASIAKQPLQGDKVLIAAGIFKQPLELEVIKEVFTEAKEPWM